MEHRPISLADQVFERLEKNILAGQYARGEVLTELRLVEDLGVSRTPIREAVRRLEQEHIISITPKGIVVLGVSKEDLSDIYAIRMRIEGLSAEAAARQVSDEQLREMRETIDLQEYYVNRGDAERIIQQDSRFHELLYRCSGSSVLYHTLLPLHNKVQKYRHASVEDPDRAVKATAEHREIYEALAAHDGERAARAVTEHAMNAREHILQDREG